MGKNTISTVALEVLLARRERAKGVGLPEKCNRTATVTEPVRKQSRDRRERSAPEIK